MKGHIIKGYSGFYYVFSQGKIYECSLRGKNRCKSVRFLVGDLVNFEIISEDKGVIEKLLPRKNQLLRPPIANVDQLIIAAAAKEPSPDLRLIDRLSILAQWNNIEPIICFNKSDLITEEERQKLQAIYQPTGFRLFWTSVLNQEGIDALKQCLKGKISVFAGNSGVGKSSLMNALGGHWQLATGKVSEKLKRGRHTTRHVELFSLDENALLADTPGFSSLMLPEDLKREELGKLFPELMFFLGQCRFATCLHHQEPDCAVKEAVANGNIAKERYESYLIFLQEVIAAERSY